MTNKDSQPKSETEVREGILLRLFRCMTADEQCDVVRRSLQAIASRCSVDPYFSRLRPEVLTQELHSDLSDRLGASWPATWKGQIAVDLDNVGDPGSWIDEVFGEPLLEVLFGWAWDDAGNAHAAAISYLEITREQGFPVPSDFSEAPNYEGWSEEDEQQVSDEIAAFLAAWRERVLITLEMQHAARRATGNE